MPVTPRQPGRLTWLHLSDIHFGEKRAAEQVAVLNRLLDDVRERRERHDLAPDLIFVTGDIAWSGQPTQYEADALPFLTKLQAAADLPADRVFLIPGNHDVDRSAVKSRAVALLQDDLLRNGNSEAGDRLLTDLLTAPGFSEDRALILRKHAAYVEFVKTHYPHCAPDGDPLWYARPLEFAGLPFSRLWVVGLNSAWLGRDGEEKARMLLGYPQVVHALGVVEKNGDAKNDFIVSLAHHPFSWFPEWDERLCGQQIDARCDFHLTGHLHETYLNLRNVNGPQRCSMMAAGSAYGGGQWYNGYHFVRLDFETGKARAYLRRYEPTTVEWTGDPRYRQPDNGQFEWDLPKRFQPTPTPPTPINNKREPVIDLLAEYRETLAERTGKVRLFGDWKFRKLEEVFVELTVVEEYAAPSKQDEWKGLLDAAVRERFEARLTRDEESDENDDRRREQKIRRNVKPDELLRDGARAVVVGAPGSGKSTLMRWLASKTLAEGHRLPVFIELKSLPDDALGNGNQGFAGFLFDFGIAPLVQTRLDAHPEEREPIRATFCQLIERGEVAVFLDGLDEVRDRPFFGRLHDLVERFADEKRNGLIVSTRPDDLKPFAGLEAMEIAPLDDRQIAAFLRLYFSDEFSKKLTSEFTGRRDVRDLARVPFLLAVIASLYEKEKELVGERLELYRRIVLALGNEIDAEKDIKKFHLSDPDGALKRDFLKFLAYERLFNEKLDDIKLRLAFTTDDLISIARRYCEKYEPTTKPRLLAADAKATPLLREIGKDRYAFVYLTIQEYLAATALVERPDCEKVFCRAFFDTTLAEMEVLPMALGLVDKPDALYDALEHLPESLDFKNLRLRARGLRYVDRLAQKWLDRLAERLLDFALRRIAEESPYSERVLDHFSGDRGEHFSGVTERLLAALRDEDKYVRRSAAEALGKLGAGTPEVVAGLLAALRDADWAVRASAAEALRRLGVGTPEVVSGLLSALRDEERFVRVSAAQALGDLEAGTQEIVTGLLSVLRDKEWLVRWSAEEALRRLGAVSSEVMTAVQDDFVENEVVSRFNQVKNGESEAVIDLVEVFQDQDADLSVRWTAMGELGRLGIGTPELITGLVKVLRDDDGPIRDRAAEMLGRLGIWTLKVVEGLTAALRDDWEIVRESAAEALGKIPASSLTSALAACFSNEDKFVRTKAASVVGYYAEEVGLLSELQKLATGDPIEEVREAARDALERYKLKLKYFDKEVPEFFESVGRESALESSHTYVAHELRNILTPLKAFAWGLKENVVEDDGFDPARVKSMAERILGQTDLAFRAVERYLDYSKPLVPSLQITDIQAFLCNCLREVEAELVAASIRAECSFEHLPKTSVDSELLRDAVRNVLRNAIEAMKDGGTLTVFGSAAKQSVVIEIRDTGPGFNPDHLNRVFDLGFSTKADKHGSGIGLALVQRIVRDAHRGRVTATNNSDGPGATIRIELPIVEEKHVNGKPTV